MEAQETKLVAIIKIVSIYLVAVLVAATFLIHIILPVSPKSLSGIKAERSSISNKVDEYVAQQLEEDTKYIQLRTQYETLNAEYQTKRKAEFISGFPSWHKFTWHFGIGLIIVVMGIFILTMVNQYKGARKKAINFASMAFITCGGYYMAWIFFPYDDLPENIYFTILVGMGVIAGIATRQILRINYQTRIKLTKKVQFLFGLIGNTAIDKGLVKDVQKWDTEITDPALRKINE